MPTTCKTFTAILSEADRIILQIPGKSTAEVGINVAADRCSGAQGGQVAGPEVVDRWIDLFVFTTVVRRPSIARHSIRIEEREEVGGLSSSRIPQGRGKGKAPAPPSDDDDEEDEDYVAPDAEEIDMSQLPDAPQGTQPTQYNLRSTQAAKKRFSICREAEGGANHPGAAVGEGGASQCHEAEGFRGEEGGASHPSAAVREDGASRGPEAEGPRGERGGARMAGAAVWGAAPAIARRQKLGLETWRKWEWEEKVGGAHRGGGAPPMLAPSYARRRQGGWRPALPSQQCHVALVPWWHGHGANVAGAAMLGDGASHSGAPKRTIFGLSFSRGLFVK
uniref:Uncharacterized protein n=1 Tax=Oryza sativa subsp. japonica TaxID=39947 RepID=Q338E0_ORYSJ|nr:hypothetical protein LOC_Os10g27100 [Oryza sativa Japonica Group]